MSIELEEPSDADTFLFNGMIHVHVIDHWGAITLCTARGDIPYMVHLVQYPVQGAQGVEL